MTPGDGPACAGKGTRARPHDNGVERGADKPQHLQSLADVRRVTQQLLAGGDEALRGVGRSLAVLLERAQGDLQRVLQRAREGTLVGVPANLGAWPPDEAGAYVERHLELLVRLNPDDAHLVALQRRRPELFARGGVAGSGALALETRPSRWRGCRRRRAADGAHLRLSWSLRR